MADDRQRRDGGGTAAAIAALWAALAAVCLAATKTNAETNGGLELVLAVDTSGSVADAADAEAFADRLEAQPRADPRGGTGIGRGIIYAVWIMEGNGLNGTRRVADVPGDGRETAFRCVTVPPEQARAYAAARPSSAWPISPTIPLWSAPTGRR